MRRRSLFKSDPVPLRPESPHALQVKGFWQSLDVQFIGTLTNIQDRKAGVRLLALSSSSLCSSS